MIIFATTATKKTNAGFNPDIIPKGMAPLNSETEFESFQFKNGFNKGDLMILKGKNPSDLDIGNTIVFTGNRDPVIHRLVSKEKINGKYLLSTKGDNNAKQLSYEQDITEEQLIGKAIIRVPLLGYVKIIFADTVKLLLKGG